jgi:hypothetical protein
MAKLKNWLPLSQIRPEDIGSSSGPILLDQIDILLGLIREVCPDAWGYERGKNTGWAFAPAALRNGSAPRNLITIWANSESVKFTYEPHQQTAFDDNRTADYRARLHHHHLDILDAHGLKPEQPRLDEIILSWSDVSERDILPSFWFEDDQPIIGVTHAMWDKRDKPCGEAQCDVRKDGIAATA